MQVYDLITQIGDELGEDFVHSVVWTRDMLLKYVRQTLKEFSGETQIVDKVNIRLLEGTSGESTVPPDFGQAYYVIYNNNHLDLVQLGDLDFIDEDWSISGTATTPLAATQIGTGRTAKVRLAPVPASPTTATDFASYSTTIYRMSPTDITRLLTCNYGVLSTGTTTASTGTTIVLSSASAQWAVSVNTSDVLVTTSTSSTGVSNVVLVDSTDGLLYRMSVSSVGCLSMDLLAGKLCQFSIDGTVQTFDSNYGIVVNVRAAGSSNTPAYVGFSDQPVGTVIYYRSSENATMLWYKGGFNDVSSLYSYIHLSSAILPVIKHGVLAKAYNHDGPGRDSSKAKTLEAIFKAECTAIKALFQKI